MSSDKTIKQIEKELHKSEIKEANGIDGMENLLNALDLAISIAPEPEKKNVRAFRWQNGLSSIDKPDMGHDLNRLKDFAQDLSIAGKENYEQLADTISNIIVEINTDAEKFFEENAIIEEDIDERYLQEYDAGKNIEENKDFVCEICSLFADEMMEKISSNQKIIPEEITIKTMVILSLIDRFIRQCKNEEE